MSFSDRTVQEKVATLNAVTDQNAQLFEEMFRNIESGLAAAQKLPSNPLCITTVLYEDDAGDIRPIITDDDRKWVAAQERARGKRPQGI